MCDTDKFDFTLFYYAYSTIAQSLAGVIGLLGALFIWQIQKGEENKEKYWQRVQKHGQGDLAMKWTEFYATEVENMKSRFYKSIKWTAGVVIACFLLIPLTSDTFLHHKRVRALMPWDLAVWIPLGLVLLASILTVTGYGRLIKGLEPIELKFKSLTKETQGQEAEDKGPTT